MAITAKPPCHPIIMKERMISIRPKAPQRIGNIPPGIASSHGTSPVKTCFAFARELVAITKPSYISLDVVIFRDGGLRTSRIEPVLGAPSPPGKNSKNSESSANAFLGWQTAARKSHPL